MYIYSDGLKLNIQIDRPENGDKKCPLVIIFHGFTGHMEERHIVAVSKALNDIGCATLRVDMYGHGKSGGAFKDHTLFKWLTNALTVFDYSREMDWVSGLYLCGHSQGGLTAMLAAGMEHERIKGLIPLSPAAMIPDSAREGRILGTDFDPCHIPELIRSDYGWELGGNYLRVAQMIHVEDAIESYRGPVLLVHGEEDEAVPVSVSIEAQRKYAHANLVLIPGDTHCYDYHLDQVTEAVKRWMMKQIGCA